MFLLSVCYDRLVVSQNSKQCLHCGCPRGSHYMETEPSFIIPALQQLSLSHKPMLTMTDAERLGKYSWYPSGVSYGMVRNNVNLIGNCCDINITEVSTFEGGCYLWVLQMCLLS